MTSSEFTSKEANLDRSLYHVDDPAKGGLDDRLLRQAVDMTPIPSEYRPLTCNCQTWAQQVWENYKKLVGKPSLLLLSGGVVIDDGGSGGGGGSGPGTTTTPGGTTVTPSASKTVTGRTSSETVTGKLVPPKELPTPETGKLGDPKYKNPKGAFGSRRI